MVLRYFTCLFVFTALNVLTESTVLAAECTEIWPRLALHVEAPTSKRTCGLTQLTCNPAQVVSTGDLHQTYKVYVVLLDWALQNLQEVQFGVDYDPVEGSGVDVLSFETCGQSSTPIGDWPNPGSQVRLTYPTCQSTQDNEALVLGWFWVIAETPGSLSIGPLNWSEGNASNVCRLRDCEQNEKILTPMRYGKAGFGGASSEGCSFIDVFPGPCCTPDSCIANSGLGCCWAQNGTLLDYMSTCAQCVLPVLPKTWGQLKSLYK